MRYVFVFLWLLTACSCLAFSQTKSAAMLSGIDSLSVYVERLSPAALSAGLTEAQLTETVEQRFKSEGLNIAPSAPQFFYLHLLATDEPACSTVVFVLKVEFCRESTLPGKEDLFWGRVWMKDQYGMELHDGFSEAMLANVSTLLDMFIEDVRSVNPRLKKK